MFVAIRKGVRSSEKWWQLSSEAFTLESYPCPLCRSVKKRTIAAKRGRVIPIRFTIVSCASCGHVRVDPRIPDERLGDLYGEAYYRGEGFDATIDYGSTPNSKTIDENDDIVSSVSDANGGSVRGLRWLDIGCGTGALIEAARLSGAIVTGSDSSEQAEASCRRRGLPFLTPSELASEHEAFDVVSAIEVIEHVADPLAFVAYLTSHVRDGGTLIVRTGNWNVVRFLPGTPYIMPEGHIQYFTPRTMRRVFRLAGIEETGTFNRSWFLWRLLPRLFRRKIPLTALSALAKLTVVFLPALAPYPIGRVRRWQTGGRS